jgi:hypothetical protein
VRDFGAVMDPNCMKTMDCIAACPNDALSFGFGRPAAFTRERAHGRKSRIGVPTWPEELLLGVAYAFGFFATHSLYGRFPFLLALGFGMIAAFGILSAKRLLQRADYRLGGRSLKHGGRLTPRGMAHLLLIVAGAGLLGHSLWIQQHRRARDAAFAETNAYRGLWLQGGFPLDRIPVEAHVAMDVAAVEARWLRQHGLLREDLDSFVLGWQQLFEGSAPGLERAFEEVLELRPGFGEVQLQYAFFLMNMGRPVDALQQLDAVSPRDPRFLSARESAIRLQERRGEHADAERRRLWLSESGFGGGAE